MIDMTAYIAARSDQLNADDLMDSPRTITVTKVTASPDAAEQPVSIHYEGDNGKPLKPCKTVRRILVGVWGKDASKYVGRSMTLYRDPSVSFGGMQVGGIRVSHMSHISEKKTVALQVTRGRKAPFTILPLASAPAQQTSDFSGQLAELKSLAKPGNMDALGAKWQEIGPEARKALSAELPALKAACQAPADDVDAFGLQQPEPAAQNTLADQLGLDDDPTQRIHDDLETAADAGDGEAVERLIAAAEARRGEFSDEQLNKLEIAYSKARGKVAKVGA